MKRCREVKPCQDSGQYEVTSSNSKASAIRDHQYSLGSTVGMGKKGLHYTSSKCSRNTMLMKKADLIFTCGVFCTWKPEHRHFQRQGQIQVKILGSR